MEKKQSSDPFASITWADPEEWAGERPSLPASKRPSR